MQGMSQQPEGSRPSVRQFNRGNGEQVKDCFSWDTAAESRASATQKPVAEKPGAFYQQAPEPAQQGGRGGRGQANRQTYNIITGEAS